MGVFDSFPKLPNERYRAQLKDGGICIVTEQQLIRIQEDGSVRGKIPFSAINSVGAIDSTNMFGSNQYVMVWDYLGYQVSRSFEGMALKDMSQCQKLKSEIEVAMLLAGG